MNIRFVDLEDLDVPSWNAKLSELHLQLQLHLPHRGYCPTNPDRNPSQQFR